MRRPRKLPRRSSIESGILLGVLTLFVSQASAQTVTERHTAAEALFRAGREASGRGDYATACEKFRESHRLERAYGTLLNIGVCEEAVGQLASAWQRYQDILYSLPANEPWAQVARQRMQGLDLRLPRVTLERAPGAAPDTQATVGILDVLPQAFGTALPLDPGQHVFIVSATGHQPRTYTLTLREGERRSLQVEPGPVLPPVPSPAKPSKSTKTTDRRPRPADGGLRRSLGLTALGVAGASLLTSLITFGFVLERKATVDDHCPSDDSCDPQGVRAARSGRTLLVVSATSAGIGLAAGGLGILMLQSRPAPAVQSSVIPKPFFGAVGVVTELIF
jgi:hypothetical protein